jgi:acyl dehydratase
VPLNPACLNRTYGPSTFEVSSEGVRAFTAATLAEPLPPTRDGRDVALPTMAFAPCWPVIQEAIADPDLGNQPGQIIHGEQVMRFRRPLLVGDTLETTGTVTRIEPKGRNEVYVLHLESRDTDGDLVVEQDNICISLGSAAETTDATSQAPRAPRPVAVLDDPVAPTWFDEQELPVNITQEYARASGDFSEVHLDDEFARSLGFPGIIVHGMCLLSVAVRPVLARALGDDLTMLRGIRVRFASPVQPGESIRTEYTPVDGSYGFTTFAGDRKVLGAGMVEVAPA